MQPEKKKGSYDCRGFCLFAFVVLVFIIIIVVVLEICLSNDPPRNTEKDKIKMQFDKMSRSSQSQLF